MTQPRRGRHWLAPEVVQTSAMDCGPAALKCLLEGFKVPVSYGRLREACQTDVDGTSIDVIESVSADLGLHAEQVMIPVDHVFAGPSNLPALIVVRQPDASTHFVVAWRSVGRWVQVMDPAVGRRWMRRDHVQDEIFRHQTPVAAAHWREWAGTEDHLAPLRARLSALGGAASSRDTLMTRALADQGWFSLGALDASVRLGTAIVAAEGVRAGAEALSLVTALFDGTCQRGDDIFSLVPPAYWSVVPDASNDDASEERLVLSGAVLVRVSGRTSATTRATSAFPGDASAGDVSSDRKPLSPELAAALAEPRTRPLAELWRLLKADGVFAPLAMAGAMTVSAATVLIEALLFRAVFSVGTYLPVGSQRLGAAVGLVAFMVLTFLLAIPIIHQALRMGRHLDTRLRMALVGKLPRLSDRYFHSRPVSDLADRGHSIHHVRRVPSMGIHFAQAVFELAFTLIGVAWVDPASAPLALGIAAISILVPALCQPVISERDLRVRNHVGALSRFYLDALLGLVPIRAHSGEAAVRYQHEGLLVEWVRSTRRLIRTGLMATALQAGISLGLATVLIGLHFLRSGGVTGADLLLLYWVLRLPSTGHTLMSLAHQYPTQRNIVLRLLEPLSAPERLLRSAGTPSLSEPPAHAGHARDAVSRHRSSSAAEAAGAWPRVTTFSIERGVVVAGGHTILRDLQLRIAGGEHVAIVGPSGAGKSTLLGLLLGWHRLAEGTLQVDGRHADDEVVGELRRRTAWVDPAVQLWNRSLLSNVAYSSLQTDPRRLAAALDAASLRGVLQRLPEGMQTPLGEGGALLSGGEGQRVRLARTLAQMDVSLVLLDEPFRGLDRGQRSALLARARVHWRQATLLCVTHDVRETLTFDRVLVIDDGRLVEDGIPTVLSELDSRYRALLDAEERVREHLWQDDTWRRVVVDQGGVSAVDEPRSPSMPRTLEHAVSTPKRYR